MANLPESPRRFVFTPQIESSISGADVARPYGVIADALGAVAGAAGNVADANAKADGANAVVRDDQGNLQVTQRSNLTAGGREYNAMALQTYLARSSNDAQSALQKIGLDAKGNPDTFTTGAQDFNRKMLQNAPSAVRGQLQTMLEGTAQEIHDGIVVQKRNADTKSAFGAFTAKRDLLDDQLAAIARGGGTGTRGYAEKRDEFRNLWQTLADNPDFNVSQEEASIGVKRAESRHLAEAAVGSIQRVYQRDGMAAAETAANSLIDDTSLDLSPAERRQYRSLALSDIRASESQRKADLRLYRPEAMSILSRVKSGEGLDEADVDEAIKALGEMGDPVLAGKLIRARASGRFVKEFQGMPDATQLSVAQQALAPSTSFVDRVAQVESGGNAHAQAGTSSARGLGQFTTGTWGAFLAERHPDLIGSGQDFRTDPTLSKEAIAWYAEKNTADLKSAGFEATPGNLYLAHFLGPQGAVAMLKADSVQTAASVNPAAAAANRSVFYGKDGTPRSAAEVVAWADRKMGGSSAAPSIDPEALKEMRSEITKDAKSNWVSIKNGFLKGQPPPADEMKQFAGQVALVDDGDFRQEVADQLQNYAGGYLLGNMAPAEAQQAIADIRAGMPDALNEIQRDALDTYQQVAKDSAQAIKADAVGYGQARGLVPVPPPLDFSSPQSTAMGMAGREKAAATARQMFAAPDVPALRPAEAESVAATIATGPPDQAQNTLTALANVSDDSLASTIGMTPIKDAIAGAVRGNDPTKFASAMTALDTLWGRAPATVSATFGGDVVDTLQDWQAKLRYYTQDELVNELKARNDPQAVERRKRLENAGREIVRKQSVDSVVAAFDPGYFTTGPSAPNDPLTSDMFMSDYETMFASRYAATLDQGTAQQQAVARMREKWTRSDINGGRITYLAPEGEYPPVDGSWKWMHDQLAADLSTFGNAPSEFSVVADRRTEADKQAGQQPSYLVTIKRSDTGEFDLVRNADGTPMRYRWDASKVQADAESKFKAERDRIFAPRTTQFPLH